MAVTTVFTRPRSIFWLRVNENDDGSYNFFVSESILEIFRYHFPFVELYAPMGWQLSKGGTKYIWIPPDNAGAIDLVAIKAWASFAGCQCVWLKTDLSLAYCLAADFNFSVEDGTIGPRTPLGDAEYWLKYRRAEVTQEAMRGHVGNVCHGIKGIFEQLPLAYKAQSMFSPVSGVAPIAPPIVSPIPANRGKGKLAWALAKYVATQYGLCLITPTLAPEKPEMKTLNLEQKKQAWQQLYSVPQAVSLAREDVSGKEIVIVDDLFQSGATMHAYASFLKWLGAERVFGISCVKSMRDSDNQ